jgi:ABC-type transport system substrate-binding protein
MRKIVKSVLITIVAALLISSIAPAVANIQDVEQPRLDEIYMKVISDPDAATTAFQNCEVDVNPDMIRWSNVEKLVAEGNTIYSSPGFHYCYIGINCRDYVPDDAGQPDAGRALNPLNWTDFRAALSWAGLSEAEKAAAILQIYGGPINVPCNTPVPPALGVWHDPTVPAPGCNFTRAWEELEASGFTIVGDLLYDPNGVVVRDEIHVQSPSEAPTSVAFTQKWINKWNLFFGTYLGLSNCVFVHDIIPFNTEVENAFLYRNFDLYFLCYGLGRFADYLYDIFHSSSDYPWGDNSYGIHDAELDALLEIIKWGTNLEDKYDACHAAQNMLVLELCPAVYLYSRTYYNAFKNYAYYGEDMKLVNMVNSYGYGADNSWTWALMHWNTSIEGGSANYVLGAELDNIHPGWADSAYEWDVLNKIEDGLIAVNPDLFDIPWIACDWDVTPFVWEPLNVDGIKVRFQIRDGVTWHDGYPVTVEDIKFAMDNLHLYPQYASTYEYLVWTQIVDPCTVDVYLNTTSQFIVYDIAGLGLLFPKHIYSLPGADTAAVWEIDYEDWTGEAPPVEYPFMKALVGCGPYVFDYYDPSTSIVHVVKYQDYWVDGPLKQNFIQPQRVDPDTEFGYSVEVVNTGSKDIVTGELVPAVIDYIEITLDGDVIDIIPGPIVIASFDYIVLSGYTYPGLPAGFHYLDCHTYEEGELIDEYECPIWVTIKEDTNLDFKVDLADVLNAALAFGSFPGHARWDERADINGDYKVDLADYLAIAILFGWVG